MGRNGRRVIAVLAIAGLGLVATACGGDDDDDAAPAAENDSGDDGGDEGDNGDGGDANVSDDCKDVMGKYLEKLEPFIEDIDWENATPDTFTDIEKEMGDDLDDADRDLQEECGEFEFGEDSAQLEAMIDVANDRAPGTVAFLTFLQGLSQAFSDLSLDDITIPDNITIPDISLPDNVTLPDNITIPDITIPDITVPGGENAADLPTDCQGAIDYMRGLMDQYDTMLDMPANEMMAIGNLTTTISSSCSVNEMSDFYNDPDITSWMSGT